MSNLEIIFVVFLWLFTGYVFIRSYRWKNKKDKEKLNAKT